MKLLLVQKSKPSENNNEWNEFEAIPSSKISMHVSGENNDERYNEFKAICPLKMRLGVGILNLKLAHI